MIDAPGCRHASGATLAEVVLALGLLAGLVLSGAGLAGQGQRQLRGAARSSQALALARGMIEELELRAFDRVHGALGCPPAAPTCRVGSPDAAVAAWHAAAGVDLPRPRVEIRVEALGATGLDAARALRVTAVVEWREGQRVRRVRLTTLRV